MSTSAKIAAFVLGLAAVFGAALGVGALAGPVSTASADASPAGHGGMSEETSPAAADPPAGLQVVDRGFTLALGSAELPPGPATPLTFRILGADGAAVTSYQESHEKLLHLIAVRRDLSGFQHVHPTLSGDGVWTTPLALTPGSWRILADFVPTADGQKRVLGADIVVPGDLRPEVLPATSRTVQVDGYTVTLAGQPRTGAESELTFTISRDGRPVTDVQPYLGAYGHLVVLRAGDLAYLHVHPSGEPGDGRTAAGPAIGFMTTAPSAGTYRLFLDFRHGDAVHTAAFTVTVDH